MVLINFLGGKLVIKISGRNKMPATIKEIIPGTELAKVVMDCRGIELLAIITIDFLLKI